MNLYGAQLVLHRHWNVGLLLVMIASQRSLAQGAGATPPANQLQEAAALFTRSDWPGALAAYEALAKAYPQHALSRFRVGVSLLELNRLAEAESSLKKGEQLGIAAGPAAFRLAQVFAEQKRGDAAIAELERAARAQMLATPSSLEADRHFTSLKAHAKWKAVLDQFDAIVQPCLHDPRYRQLDYWIGDWDVRAAGQTAAAPPARNTITLEDNGCVVTEHWTAPGGSEGQSFNIYDASFGQWRQTWVDNVGGQHDYRGSLQDGNMVYRGELPGPRGTTTRVTTRLTFFPINKDSVRQFAETSSDGGATWQTSYDLRYSRRRSDAAPPSAYSGPLTAADRAAILAVDSSFVRGWLRDDTTAVLDLFETDAVLIPPGAAAVQGRAAIRAYWWPTDGSHTTIRAFAHSVQEIGGTRALAFVRGTSELRWDYAKNGSSTSQTSRSSDMRLLARDSLGKWRIIRQMWSALP
jgi:ketosteroid isomerase-like protein